MLIEIKRKSNKKRTCELLFWDDTNKSVDSLTGCHLISLSSTAGLCGRPNITTYCATKYAISGFTEAFHVEEVVDKGNSNANVSTVYPFIINTGLAKRPISRQVFFSLLDSYKSIHVGLFLILPHRNFQVSSSVSNYQRWGVCKSDNRWCSA